MRWALRMRLLFTEGDDRGLGLRQRFASLADALGVAPPPSLRPRSCTWLRITVVIALLAHGAAAEDCERVPVWSNGHVAGSVCRAEATELGFTVLDLRDDWVPAALDVSVADQVPSYRATYLALAQERWSEAGADGVLARGDRYLELFGIAPTLTVVRERLDDDARHACHAGIDSASFATGQSGSTAVRAVQAHLACDRLLASPPNGRLTWETTSAIATFQRGAMIIPTGRLDGETRAALARSSYARDAATALRVLRARVTSATGLLEDGSALTGSATVRGVALEAEDIWHARGHSALDGAAPDLISPATEAAAAALGWRDAAAIRVFLDRADPPGLVAVRLPRAPRYHSTQMALSIVVDLGDRSRRPALIVYAAHDSGRIALARWPTTAGGWQDQVVGGCVVRRWKASPIGARVWRDLFVGPTWLPPATTPDAELVHATGRGAVLAREVLGPSYRAAFGFLAFVHLVEVHARGELALEDEGIRTHATGNLRSIVDGASHGCHRLFGIHAVRLASFVLAHRGYVVHGDTPTYYRRIVRHRGTFPIAIDSLGYRIELVPPVPVEVVPTAQALRP